VGAPRRKMSPSKPRTIFDHSRRFAENPTFYLLRCLTILQWIIRVWHLIPPEVRSSLLRVLHLS
jgi:hypothetical protein